MITWREFLIGVIVALSFYVIELVVFIRASRKPSKSSESQLDKQLLAEIRAELAELRHEYSVLHKELGRLKDDSKAPAPYSQAIRMVRQGLGPSEIAAACNISKGEAELIASLHKGRG